MKTTLYSLLIIGVLFGLCIFAFTYKEKQDSAELMERNKLLKQRVAAIEAMMRKACDDLNKEEAKLKAKYEQDKKDIKNALLIVLPDHKEVIENAFKPKQEKEKTNGEPGAKT